MERSKNLHIRLTEAEKQGFETAANIAGIDVSSWARERLRMLATQELHRLGIMAPFLDRIPLRPDEK